MCDDKTFGIWGSDDRTEMINTNDNFETFNDLSENVKEDMKRCMGCMELYSSNAQLCPYCGYYDGEEPESPTQLQPGTRLNDRYIMGKSVGSGGFGITYVAWDTVLDSKVAVKEYLPGEFSTRSVGQNRVTVFSGDKTVQFQDGKDKFFDEAKRLVKFQNESGIVKVFDCFKENNTAYIVMEYLDGETLEEYLKREGKIDSETAIEMMLPVIESLNKVHEEGILHRDVSPDNIFLTKDGKVKLLDFGASRYATTSKSRSLSVLIKQGYSAEEQYRSKGDQGPHTDVYSMGATLYKMVTGETPPDALVRRVKYEKSGKDMLIPIRRFSEDITENHESAIYNAMNVRIEDRTPDMKTLESELTCETKVKRRKGTIKKIDIYNLPLWVKITVPIVILIFVVLGLLLAFGVIGPRSNMDTDYSVESGKVVVPNVIQLTVEDSEIQITNKGLQQIAQKSDEPNEKIPFNTIMKQSPEKGKTVPANSVIEVIISIGHGLAEVENVVGMPIEEAKKKLETAGFKVEYTEEYDATSIGCVISQDKKGLVEKTSTVNLVVSKGIGDVDTSIVVSVPNLYGMSLEEAREAVSKLNLQISSSDVFYADRPDGVIEQSPNSGTVANQGDIVYVKVNNKTTIVPDLEYTSEAMAKEMLTQLNLNYHVEDGYSSGYGKDTVYNQSVSAGTEVQKGTVITIYVCRDENQPQVPNQPQTVIPNTTKQPQITQRQTESNSNYEYTVPPTSKQYVTTTVPPTTKAVFTVYFDANGGSLATTNQISVKSGDAVYLPTPERDYYVFDGWYTSRGGGERITSNTPINRSLTLYAHWNENPISDWVLAVPSGASVVDQKTEYRYRDKEYRNGQSENSLSGWTQYNKTPVYSQIKESKSPVTETSTVKPTGSGTKKETRYKTVYWYKRYVYSMNGNKYWSYGESYAVNQGCPGKWEYTSSETEFRTYAMTSDGVAMRYISSKGTSDGWWYKADCNKNQGMGHTTYAVKTPYDVSVTVYYYKEIVSYTYDYWRWGSWTGWSETPAYKSDTREVETRTLYRYQSR